MNLIAACVANPVKAAVGVLLVALFGTLALLTMPVQLTPEVQVPTLTVEARWLGASPQEIEQELVIPLEEQLQSVEGLTKLSSDSIDSQGSVELEFVVGTDMAEALVRVNTRLQQIRDWPIDADRPEIKTAGVNDRPVAWLILGQAPPEASVIAQAQKDHPELAPAAPTWRIFGSVRSWRSIPSSTPFSRRTSTSRRSNAWPKTTSSAVSSE